LLARLPVTVPVPLTRPAFVSAPLSRAAPPASWISPLLVVGPPTVPLWTTIRAPALLVSVLDPVTVPDVTVSVAALTRAVDATVPPLTDRLPDSVSAWFGSPTGPWRVRPPPRVPDGPSRVESWLASAVAVAEYSKVPAVQLNAPLTGWNAGV